MNSNAFTGTLELLSYLSIFGVSNNKLSGEIPNNFSSTFPYIDTLNLSYNLFEGQIHSYLGNLRELCFLDLSNSSFTREIPKELVIGCSSLMVLKLSNNKLEGEIVQEFGYLSSLEYFYLDGNNFTSTISDSLSNIPFCILDISNKFSGKIPRWMGHITSLEQLSLSQNHLEGPIPIEFCNLEHLSVLDLSKNTLIGSIPPCLNPSSIKHVHLKWIGNLSGLRILFLNGNQFEGQVPVQIEVTNEKSEAINSPLMGFSIGIATLNHDYSFELSTNEAPPKVDYEDNPYLCGPPLQVSCRSLEPSSSSFPPSNTNGESEESSDVDMEVFCISFGVSYAVFITPYLVQLVYFDRVQFKGMRVNRTYPTIVGWSAELARKRVKEENKAGSFGRGTVLPTISKPTDIAAATSRQNDQPPVAALNIPSSSVDRVAGILQKLASTVGEFSEAMAEIGKQGAPVNVMRKTFSGLSNMLNVASTIEATSTPTSSQLDDICFGSESFTTVVDALIFFPVLRHGHYFLICINVKASKLEIIDNKSLVCGVTMKDKYGDCTTLLVTALKEYLALGSSALFWKVDELTEEVVDMS
nr:LRR receptor-like serine/threonine-protein kinase GSO2 [Ipomoea batatas]